jgi:hypothetical protein
LPVGLLAGAEVMVLEKSKGVRLLEEEAGPVTPLLVPVAETETEPLVDEAIATELELELEIVGGGGAGAFLTFA